MAIETRVALAGKMLEAYRAAYPKYYEAEGDYPSMIRDLLTDLMHFSDAEDIDFNDRLEMAQEVHAEEVEDEDDTSGQDRESYSDDQDRSNYT